MQEFNRSGYDNLYPQIIPSFNQDVNLNSNRIINLASPQNDMDAVNKLYVNESLVFKKVKIADNLNLSFSEATSLQINYPSGFTISDVLNAKFVLYEFFNLSIPSQNSFYLGSSSSYGLGIFNTQTTKTIDKVSYSIPIIEKVWNNGYINVNIVSSSTQPQIMYAGPTNILVYFYCRREVTGKVSIYFIM